jgi:N-methylhydantoinase A
VSVHGGRVGVDVGGTFTDLVALVDGKLVTAKVPSTPDDQSEGVMRAFAAGGIERPDAFAHGTTVATNALLERRGVRTALVTTRGFRDVIEIGRQDRADLYDLTAVRPPPLVPRDLRLCVGGRMGPEGEIAPLDEDDVRAVVEAIREAEAESVAVCLLFSFLHPEHERAVGDALREALPDVHVSLSSEVLPEFREYERFSTTTADAYLTPKLAAYLRRLADRAEEAGVPAPLVMQSAGGVVDVATAGEGAAGFVLSGPAGGVVGAAYVARAGGYEDLLTFDMGGTSTDVAPVQGGEAGTTTESEVAGVPITLPVVDLHTVSAGGGSIAWADEGGALRVGPQSAGADPGPVAYDRGGEEPTVTDANLFLGYLPDGAELGGELVLQRELSERALAALGKRLGLDALETALGVVRVANAEMSRALRVISVERGLDPREFALVAFGGAGGLHACALAEELGMRTVLVPRAGGVLSALGLAISDVRRDYSRTLLGALDELDRDEVEQAFAALEKTAREHLDDPSLRRRADLRYRRQAFELTVEADDLDALADRFHAAHEQRYGYRMEEEPVELVNLRVKLVGVLDKPDLPDWPQREAARPAGSRWVCFAVDDWRDTPVYRRGDLARGQAIVGPAIIEQMDSTTPLHPSDEARVDRFGNLVIELR